MTRHLYVHLPFCAHRCGYCDFVTAVGRHEQHAPYVDALLSELELETGAPGAGARDRVPRRRHADLHRAARPRATARLAAAGRRGDRRGQSGDGHAGARPQAARAWRESCVARRAELPPAAASRFSTVLSSRTPSGARSTICVMPDLTTSPSISSTASPARAPPISRPTWRTRSSSGPSTCRATSSKRSPERASPTPTATSSRARPMRWRPTSRSSSTG